jgi:hypothetical protein
VNFSGAGNEVPIGPVFVNNNPSGTGGEFAMQNVTSSNLRVTARGYATADDAQNQVNGSSRLFSPSDPSGFTKEAWGTGTVHPFVRYLILTLSEFESTGSANVDLCVFDSESGGEDAVIPELDEEPEEPEDLPTPPACEDTTLCNVQDSLAHLSDQVWRLTRLVQELGQRTAPDPPTSTPTEEPISGSEVLVVSGIRALSVEYFVPGWQGSITGDPPIDLLVGYISLLTDEGWHPPIRLEHSPQVIDPLPIGVTSVAISLSPGVTATVRTFDREVL